MRMTAAILAALIAVLATPISAQDNSTGTDTDTSTDAPAEAAAPAERATDAPADGEAAPAEQDAAEEVIAAVHTDWQIRCRADGDGCYMYQLAVDSRDVPVAEMSVVSIDPAENEVIAGVTMMTPLKTFLPVGVQLQIDNGRPQRYQFEFCAQQGCIARLGLGQSGLDQFRRGNKARITVVSADNREVPIVLDVSLAGFTAAFADLSTR